MKYNFINNEVAGSFDSSRNELKSYDNEIAGSFCPNKSIDVMKIELITS
jgi:hypothetical protein